MKLITFVNIMQKGFNEQCTVGSISKALLKYSKSSKPLWRWLFPSSVAYPICQWEAGYTMDRLPVYCWGNTYATIHTFIPTASSESPINLICMSNWEEVGVPGENPQRHRDNIHPDCSPAKCIQLYLDCNYLYNHQVFGLHLQSTTVPNCCL